MLKTYCAILLVCTMLSGCNLANIMKMRYANDDIQPQWPESKTSVVLATRYIGEKPFVYANVAGAKDLLFMIDTGASMSLLIDTPKVVGLNLPKGYTLSIGGWGDEGDSEIYQTKVASFELGSVTFTGVNMAFLPASKTQYFAHPDEVIYDGVIGHDILRHFSWTFDKEANRISISSLPYQTTGHEDTVDFDTFFSKISLQSEIDFGDGQNISQELIIDTGSRHYLYPSYLKILFQSYHSGFSTRRMGEGMSATFQTHATQ